MMLTHRLLAVGKRCSSFAITIKFQSIFPIIPNANLAGRCRKSKSNRPICIGKITQIHQLSCASKHHYLYRYEHTSLGSQKPTLRFTLKEAKNDVIFIIFFFYFNGLVFGDLIDLKNFIFVSRNHI